MKPERHGRVRCSAWLGRAFLWWLVVVINLFLCCLGRGERLPEMCANLPRCPKAAIKLADQVCRMNKVNVQRLNLAPALHREVGVVFPILDGGAHGQLSNLPPLITAAGEPQIQGSDAAADNGGDGGAQNRGAGYIELHDWLMIMGGWIFGAVLGSGVVIWWCVVRPNETSSETRPT